jgi:ABC-type bacteriocin/lantibiotic exporter with double-glycine peptidase domain
MVLSSHDFHISEAELRELCDCTPFGTDPFPAVLAARHLKFENTRSLTLTLAELAELVGDENYPFVEVNMGPIDGIKTAHALVVLAVGETTVTVSDPMKGEREIPVDNFIAAWEMRDNLATLVMK